MGKIVHTYEILEQLGQGGMGVVYKARHIHFDEIYAIKRLWEQFSANEMVLNLFLNEAKILRRLNHKNIVHVTDIFSIENQNYIVMEYVKGRSLDEVIKKEVGPIRRERAINLFKQILEGIAYIHNQPAPIIHRDIKPLNILVTDDDTVKITDFGIAKALDAGGNASTVMKGTPVYMSPEQIINPKSVDIRTDVYSLGMTFYEMLCAKTPFSGDTTTTPTAVYAAIINGEVPPPTQFYPGITDALSDFVMKAIHKERNYRFANANEMLLALDNLERSGQTTVQDVLAEDLYHFRLHHSTGETTVQDNPGFIPPFAPKKNHENRIDFGAVPKQVETFSPQVTPGPFNCREMVLVDGGRFMMGSYDGEPDEKPVHEVTVTSFLIGKYQVTQELWQKVMGNNPSNFKGENRPVESVSWFDAVDFCNKLSVQEGLSKCYSKSIVKKSGFLNRMVGYQEEVITCDFNANGYRLPTEAEWEYAARSGNKSKGYKYSGSNEIEVVSWYGYEKSGRTTHDVGIKLPNELGIYDMSGNVWEWCWDRYGSYTSTSETNPKGANSGSYRVRRGGSWFGVAERCRVAYRDSGDPGGRSGSVGLRLVRTR